MGEGQTGLYDNLDFFCKSKSIIKYMYIKTSQQKAEKVLFSVIFVVPKYKTIFLFLY